MWALLGGRFWGALALAVALAGTHWAAYRHGAASRDGEVAALKAEQAGLHAAYAAAALQAQAQLAQAAQAKASAVAAADARWTKEIDDAKRKSDADRAALRAGTGGVRLNGANCTAAASGSAVPAAPAAPRVADAAAGGLPSAVAENVLDLRLAIERDAAQIAGLQDYLRAVTGQTLNQGADDGGH